MLTSAKGSQPGRVLRTRSLLAAHRPKRAEHGHRIRRGDGEAGGLTLPRSEEEDNGGPRQPQYLHPSRAPRGVRASARILNRLDSIHGLLEDGRVVEVGRGEYYRERDAVLVRNKVALRARFASIRRVLAGFFAPPLLAGTLAESKEARDQSISSAFPRRSKSTRCSPSHTPASSQSRRRRQQVEPEPQPISWGNISQGTPLFKTKMMPVRAALSVTRSLPLLGLGGSARSSGSTIYHSSSVIGYLAISWSYPRSQFCKAHSVWRTLA